MNTVTIENKKYPYLFGMAVLKRFAAHKKEKSINKSLTAITAINFEDPSPENMDDLASLFLFSIKRGLSKQGKECKLDIDDLIDWIYSGTEDLQKMIETFSTSIGSGEGKTKAQKEGAAVKG